MVPWKVQTDNVPVCPFYTDTRSKILLNYYFFKQPPNLIGETNCFRVVSSVQNLVFWTQRPRNKFPCVRRLFFRRLSRNVSPIPINFRDSKRYPSILIHICVHRPLRVHFFKNVPKSTIFDAQLVADAIDIAYCNITIMKDKILFSD